ncbi:MAG: hypothetical protein AAGF87_16205 [Bacteroidota bacterium]
MENSFKKLAAISEVEFRESGRESSIRQRLEGTLGTLRIIGAVLEIYLPRMADTVVGLSGGDIVESPNSDEVNDQAKLDKPEGPQGPEELDNPKDLR